MQASRSPAVSTACIRLSQESIFVAILATLGVLYATGMLAVNNRQAAAVVSLVSQRIDRVEARGALGRIDAEEQAHCK